jgi:hypothetical protein
VNLPLTRRIWTATLIRGFLPYPAPPPFRSLDSTNVLPIRSSSSVYKTDSNKFKLGSNQPAGLRRRDWLLSLLLVIVTILVYLPAWNGTPIWDDDAHLTKPELRSLQGLAQIWTQPGATQQYYPLVHTLF